MNACCLVFLIFLFTCSCNSVLADRYCDEGEKLYKAGDYRNAAKYFSQSLQTDPNSRNLYYAGCCLFKCGDYANAKNTFQMLIDKYPSSSEARLASGVLKSFSSSDYGGASRSGNSAITEKNKRILDPLADQLVSIYRHTENTDRIVGLVKEGLSHISPNVKNSLVENGYRVLVAPMTMDVAGSEETKPRGYNDGGSWDNVGGLFEPSNKRVIVGERVSWRNNPPQLNTMAASTVRHEIGHAYDQYMGKALLNSWAISSSQLFRQMYAFDAQVFTNTQRRKFEYFVQPGGAGESELFAELFFANSLSPGEQAYRSDSARELAQAFPRTFALVKDIVDQRGLERFSYTGNNGAPY